MTFRRVVLVSDRQLLELDLARAAKERRLQRVMLVLEEGDYCTVLAVGHRAESDFEREAAAYRRAASSTRAFFPCVEVDEGRFDSDLLRNIA